MIQIYFLVFESTVFLGYILGMTLFPKRYSLIFYKFFGITVFSLVLWYATMFTGKTWQELLPFVGIFLLGCAFVLARLFQKRVTLPTKQQVLELIAIEIVSFVIFSILVYVRTFKTDILGTEKLMDVALINTITKQGVLPIENPWLSGFYMNYYYFGHFILAVFQYLSGVTSAVGYNLAISIQAILILQAGYLVATSLKLSRIQSLALSFILTFGGNMYLFAQALLHKDNTAQWFASATRVIPYTINEFPSYSVILGDLHGHYLSYPFFLIGIFIICDLFFGAKQKEKSRFYTITQSTFLGLLLGHLYLTNSWDILSLGLLGIVCVLWVISQIQFKTNQDIFLWAKEIGITMVLPIVAFSFPQFLLSRKFYLPPVGGIGVNSVYSGLPEVSMLFGQFFIIALIGGIVYSYLRRKTNLMSKQREDLYILPQIFLILGFVLLMAVEFFYAKDVFSTLNPPYARTNTVFKIYFHVWAFWCFGSFALFFHATELLLTRIKKALWLIPVEVLAFVTVAIMLSYPYVGIQQYLVPVADNTLVSRLTKKEYSDGYAFVASLHSPDDALIDYLGKKDFSKILEIVTYDSYSYNARISAYTGHTTVTGWPLHNVQWYNGYDGKGINIVTQKSQLIKIAQRVTDVEKMYTSVDENEVKTLINDYAVEYVVFGNQERSWARDTKKELNTEVYKKFCKIDWQKDDAIIFKCK